MTDSAAILADLVAFDTTSALSNRPLIDHIAGRLDGVARAVHLVEDDATGKTGLIAAFGPEGPGGILLSGHTDVVPVQGQAWSSDPFTLDRREGNLYGRGTADMKGFIACCLNAVPTLANGNLGQPVYFAFSYDEEVGCLGTAPLLDRMKAEGIEPAMAIVGEPTEMTIATAHKGVQALRTTVIGREGHSSHPDTGANAIIAAAELIAYLQRCQKAAKDEADKTSGFKPPHTTFSVGTIEGGVAINVIPRSCSFTWEFRPMPGVDPAPIIKRYNSYAMEAVYPRMRVMAKDAAVETEILASVPGLEPREGNKAEALLAQLTGQNDRTVLSFAAEAGYFQQAGIDTVICGPGSIAQAHQADEFVAEEQLAACDALLAKLVRHASA